MTFLRLERCLLPAPETVHWKEGGLKVETYSTVEKVGYYAKNLFAFAGLLAVSPLTLAYDWWTEKPVTPIARIGKVQPLTNWLPDQRGYAMSLFQTSGLGTRWGAPEFAGRNDWDLWMTKASHVAHPNGYNYRNFFTDVLSNPDPYIRMLKDHGVTAHRFSLEWAVSLLWCSSCRTVPSSRSARMD